MEGEAPIIPGPRYPRHVADPPYNTVIPGGAGTEPHHITLIFGVAQQYVILAVISTSLPIPFYLKIMNRRVKKLRTSCKIAGPTCWQEPNAGEGLMLVRAYTLVRA